MRKFDHWLKNMNGGFVLSDAQQLQMLASVLPECLQKDMQLWEKERGRTPTFIEFFAHLEAKYGRAQSESMRKRWMEVQLPKGAGKYSLQAFRINFKLAVADVPDATREEARRILLEKLSPAMRKWVIAAESKNMRKSPLLEGVMLACPNVPSARFSVERWIGQTPARVEGRDGSPLSEERQAKKLLEFHGYPLKNNGSTIQIHLVEQRLSMEEIFSEVAYQLQTEERTSELQRGTQGDAHVRKAVAFFEKKNHFKAKESSSDGEGDEWESVPSAPGELPLRNNNKQPVAQAANPAPRGASLAPVAAPLPSTPPPPVRIHSFAPSCPPMEVDRQCDWSLEF